MQNEQGEWNLLVTMGTQKDEAGRQADGQNFIHKMSIYV